MKNLIQKLQKTNSKNKFKKKNKIPSVRGASDGCLREKKKPITPWAIKDNDGDKR